jgi:hypothetical protein
MLGARAPSPALSAKREQWVGAASPELDFARFAGEGARAPSNKSHLVQPGMSQHQFRIAFVTWRRSL